MKNVSIAVGIAVMLVACGGGGDSPSSSAGTTPASTTTTTPPASSTTPPAASSTTTPPTTQTFTAPVAPTSAFKLTVGGFTEGGTSNNEIVTFTGAVGAMISGKLNNIWISAAKPGGSAAVMGDLNTIVFMPGSNTYVDVTGSGNTFYVPTGAPVLFSGPGVPLSTIRNYTP